MRKNDRKETLFSCAVAFLIAFGAIYLIYWMDGYAPWGNRSLATDDGYWQYMDFFAYYHDVLLGREKISFSFGNGLGMPNFALFMYYLSSPFNLLVAFFRKKDLHDFFDLMVALKIATMAVTSNYYLRKRFEKKIEIPVSVALSISFALMQYTFSKAACSMWLDGVYMLPLILLGVRKLVRDKRPVFLAVTVALAICFNWYSAGIDCLFSIFWFFGEYAVYRSETSGEKSGRPVATFFLETVRFGFTMAAGVLLSAVMFLPMLFQMTSATRGAAAWDFFKSEFHGNLFASLQYYSMGVSSVRGSLSVFCGGLVLVGCIGFFAFGRISKTEKWAFGSLLFLGIFSCYWQPLFFLFSLLQDASSYYYRFSYVACMTMLFMAGAFFASLKESKMEGGEADAAGQQALKRVKIGTLIYVVALFVTNYFRYYQEEKLIYETVTFQLLILVLVLWAYGKPGKVLWRRFIVTALCAVTVWEMFANSRLLMDRFDDRTNLEDFRSYQLEQAALVNSVKFSDPSPYRMTQTAARAKAINQLANQNESLGFGYWALENYTSMPLANQIEFLEKSGYKIYHTILVEKAMSILPIDSLLGTKYILSPYPYETLTLRTDLASGNGKAVYQNPYAFPMAFKISGDGVFSTEDSAYTNTYEWQNALFRYVTGEDRDVWIPADFETVWNDDGSKEYRFTVPDGKYALYGNIPWYAEEPGWREEYSWLDLNGRLSMSYSTIHSLLDFYVPISEHDTSAYVRLYSGDFSVFAEPVFYLAALSYLEELAERFRSLAPADLEMDDGYLNCTLEGSAGESLFTSVPYVKGWEIRRNGEKIEPLLVEDCLMVIPLTDGTNRIEMVYHTPYVIPGLILSIFGAGLLLALASVSRWSPVLRQKVLRK